MLGNEDVSLSAAPWLPLVGDIICEAAVGVYDRLRLRESIASLAECLSVAHHISKTNHEPPERKTQRSDAAKHSPGQTVALPRHASHYALFNRWAL